MQDLSQIDIKDLVKYKNGAVLMAIVVLFIIMLNGAYTNYRSELSKVEEKISLLEQAESKVDVWDITQRRFNNLANSFLQDDPLIFKRFVEEKARAYGVVINSLRVSRAEENFYQIGTIELGVASSYRGIVNFIRELEKKNVFIDRILLRPEGRRNAAAEISLKTILLKE